MTFFFVLHHATKPNIRLAAQWLQPICCCQHLGGKISTTDSSGSQPFSSHDPIRKHDISSRPPSKIWHSHSAPAINCNFHGVQRTTDKIKNIILHVAFTVFTFICITNSTHANQWDDWACSCATSLEILGAGYWWELISCHSQRPVYCFDFCFTVMSNVNRGWNPASQKGAWGKLLERFPKTVVEEPLWAHLQIIVASFWKNYELLQILLKCGFRVVHNLFNRIMQKPVFSLRLFGRYSCNSSKTCWNNINHPTFLDIITNLT